MAEINIDGLSSLKSICLGLCSSIETSFSITNLNSLTSFSLKFSNTHTVDENITKLLDPFQNIEKLNIDGNFSYFNLDNLVNLKSLGLRGKLNDNFNFEIFKSLCNQLNYLSIGFTNNIDDLTLYKLFDGYNFSNLKVLAFMDCYIRVDKNFIGNRFPMLRDLHFQACTLEINELDVFSNLKQLRFLDMSGSWVNLSVSSANLKSLQTLNHLNDNEITFKDPELIGLEKSVKIWIRNDYFTISDIPICKQTIIS